MLASVSKVFTGSAVALLLDQGIIHSLDEDICESIPSTWNRDACRNPQYPDTNVTWRMLVTHRSSMANDIPYVVLPNGTEVQASYGPSSYKDEDGIPSFGNPTCSLRDIQNFYHAAMTSDSEASTTVGGGSIDWYQEFQKQEEGPWKSYVPGSKGEEEGYSNFAYGYIAALIEMKMGNRSRSFVKTNSFNVSA
jgi:CubicO group peptidase (beta-lactamase class C family)